MILTDNLASAHVLAYRAHAGQTDKSGNRYIEHPIRVSEQFGPEEERIVAVLHDAVEDSDLSVEKIRAEFSDEIADAVAAITKSDNEAYNEYLSRVKDNDLARSVKIEDLKDNMNLQRLGEVTDSDLDRTARYLDALGYLKK